MNYQKNCQNAAVKIHASKNANFGPYTLLNFSHNWGFRWVRRARAAAAAGHSLGPSTASVQVCLKQEWRQRVVQEEQLHRVALGTSQVQELEAQGQQGLVAILFTRHPAPPLRSAIPPRCSTTVTFTPPGEHLGFQVLFWGAIGQDWARQGRTTQKWAWNPFDYRGIREPPSL